jgi:hypothetical protein
MANHLESKFPVPLVQHNPFYITGLRVTSQQAAIKNIWCKDTKNMGPTMYVEGVALETSASQESLP